MQSALGKLSRIINRAMGGKPGETLCRRIGLRFGPSCLFCRVIGWAVRDDRHCLHEIEGYPE